MSDPDRFTRGVLRRAERAWGSSSRRRPAPSPGASDHSQVRGRKRLGLRLTTYGHTSGPRLSMRWCARPADPETPCALQPAAITNPRSPCTGPTMNRPSGVNPGQQGSSRCARIRRRARRIPPAVPIPRGPVPGPTGAPDGRFHLRRRAARLRRAAQARPGAHRAPRRPVPPMRPFSAFKKVSPAGRRTSDLRRARVARRGRQRPVPR